MTTKDNGRQYISKGEAQDIDSKEGLRAYMTTQLTNLGWDEDTKKYCTRVEKKTN